MRKRIGNDFLFYWIIKENNVIINPDAVIDFKIIIRHRRTGSEIVAEFDVVNSSPSIKCENLLYLGIYDLIATWKTVDATFIDGYRDCTADIQAFEIVSSSSSECETDLTVTSEIAIGFEGADAFEVWLKNGNEGKTYEDYIAFLQKPATDAAQAADLAKEAANNAATLANEKAALAQSSADNANAKAAEVTAAVLSAGQLGSIKPTDAAPTPARNGNYTFSIGGNKPAWLTAEAGITEVKAGDGVSVVYAAPSSYTYTHINVSSDSVTILGLKLDKSAVKQTTGTSETDVMSQKAVSDNLGLKFDKSSLESVMSQSTTKAPTSKLLDDLTKRLFNSFAFAGADLAYGVTYTNDKYLNSGGNFENNVGYKTTDFVVVKGQSQVDYIGAGHQSSVATCFYDKNKMLISSIVAHGNTTINVPINAFYLRTSTNKTSEPYVQIIAKQDSDTSKFIQFEVESLKANTISQFATINAIAGFNSALNTTYTLGYINSIGAVVSHTAYEYTDFILILGQDSVTVKGRTVNSATYLCFYDKNKTFIAGSAYAGSAANATLNVPANAYYLRGTVLVGGSRLSVILNKDVDLVALKYQEKLTVTSQEIEDSVEISNNIKQNLNLNEIGDDLMSGLVLITNFYINYSGNKYNHANAVYCVSPTIKLSNVKKIRYKGYLSNNTAIGFYSSDVISSATLVGIVKSPDQANDYTIDINVPEGAKYIVASSDTSSVLTLQLEIIEIYPITTYNEIDEQVSVNTSDIAVLKGYGMDRVPYFTREFCRNIFNSAICIGDSITQGWRTTGVFLNESYPAYLAKITGWKVMNAGQGGQTPIGWMANQFALHDYTNYDVAVICLGQNIGLTDTIDADTASEDYNTYANTNTGQYCRIIEAIRSVNPEIKMMLLSLMNNGVNTTWNVVYKIGLKYDIPVVSFVTNDIDDLTKAVYHPYNDNVHFGTIGNLAIANVVSKSIEKYVYDNMNEFIAYKE